jgi:hypothetical protein
MPYKDIQPEVFIPLSLTLINLYWQRINPVALRGILHLKQKQSDEKSTMYIRITGLLCPDEGTA